MWNLDDEIIFIALLFEQAEKEEKRRKLIERIRISKRRYGKFSKLYKKLRQNSDKFHQYFGIKFNKFVELLIILKPEISKQSTRFACQAVKPEERLAICLRFLTAGDSYKTIAFRFHLGYKTVRQIVHDVRALISKKLAPIIMPTPNKTIWEKIEKDFTSKWNFPNCIGAISGKYIEIDTLPTSGSSLFNPRKTRNIVLLALIDANYRFIYIDVHSCGKRSKNKIFSSSKLGKSLKGGLLNIPDNKPLPGMKHPVPHVIVGDETFPLKPYVMRPYPESQLYNNNAKAVFNYKLSRIKQLSECVFDMIIQKFKLYQRKIKISLNNLETIMLATCCLHNFLQEEIPVDTEITITQKETKHILRDFENIDVRDKAEARFIRHTFKNYFASTIDSTPCQAETIPLEKLDT